MAPPSIDELNEYNLPLGFHHLVQRQVVPDRAVWTSSWLLNIVCTVVVIVFGGSGYSVAHKFGPRVQDGEMGSLPFALFALFWIGVILYGISGMFHRGKLVIDRRRRELRWYLAAGLQCVNVVPFDAIQRLVYFHFHKEAVGEDSTPWTYKILVAKLRDGREVSLAVDSPKALGEAIAQDVGVEVPVEPIPDEDS